jgi:phosphatidylinositol 3-kinase
MIRLFDNLLKSEGLDLCLTPYSILATSPTTGLVEFVKGSMPISAVLGSFGSIGDFLEGQAERGAKRPASNTISSDEIRARSRFTLVQDAPPS